LLRLENQNGEAQTPTQYFKQALNETTHDASVTLHTLFPSLECFTLPPPSADNDILQNIETPTENLSPRFNRELNKLFEELLERITPKRTPSGDTVDGVTLGELVKQLVSTPEGSGEGLDLDDLWSKTVESTCGKIVDTMLSECRQAMDKNLKHLLPIEESCTGTMKLKQQQYSLAAIHNAVVAEKTRLLENKMKTVALQAEDRHRFICSFKKRTNEILMDFKEKNYAKSFEVCTSRLKELCAGLESKVQMSQSQRYPVYSTPSAYHSDWLKVKHKFDCWAVGPAKVAVLEAYETSVVAENKKTIKRIGVQHSKAISAVEEASISTKQHNVLSKEAAVVDKKKRDQDKKFSEEIQAIEETHKQERVKGRLKWKQK